MAKKVPRKSTPRKPVSPKKEIVANDPVERAKKILAPFLAAHKDCAIGEIVLGRTKILGLKKAWGEDGITILLPTKMGELAEALNNVLLPEALTAIWHKDTRQLEVIWTAFPLRGPFSTVENRKFTFRFETVDHECEFGPSSARLLIIAEHAMPTGVSETSHRNLYSFHEYVRRHREALEKDNVPLPPGKPLSFWIKNLDWNEDLALRLARRLNFFLTYYDAQSPTMHVWPKKTSPAKPRTRYIEQKFPELIDAHHIDEDLLHFWAACHEGDPARRFVYFYRIVEYTSYTYIERDVRLKIRKLLAAPHAFGDRSSLAEKVIAAALGAEADEGARITMLLRDAVDPALLWREIALNRTDFEKETKFDGGFTLKALISKDDTEVTFRTNGVSQFGGHARTIRNHLSHGRDRVTQTSIAPTTENFRKLQPWVSAISVVAGEVISHRHVL